jgi:hypothetical protein
VTKFAHRASLDLTNAFASQVHLRTHIFECANLSGAIEAESHPKNLLLALVEGLQ